MASEILGVPWTPHRSQRCSCSAVFEHFGLCFNFDECQHWNAPVFLLKKKTYFCWVFVKSPATFQIQNVAVRLQLDCRKLMASSTNRTSVHQGTQVLRWLDEMTHQSAPVDIGAVSQICHKLFAWCITLQMAFTTDASGAYQLLHDVEDMLLVMSRRIYKIYSNIHFL